jgi:hypothetical protein
MESIMKGEELGERCGEINCEVDDSDWQVIFCVLRVLLSLIDSPVNKNPVV